MAEIADRLGIAGTARAFFPVHQLIDNRPIFWLGLFELPKQDVVLFDDGRARSSMDFGLFQKPRPGGRRGGDGPDCAVLELDRGDPYVFHFDPFVSQSGRHGTDFGNVSHQPVEQIDVMNGLIHIGAAPIQIPGPAPACFYGSFGPFGLRTVVIGLRTPPFDEGVGQGQLSKAALRDRFF